METTHDTFSYLEYISVFTAFIYGYVATRFFSGWSAMINFRHHIKFSKEHLLWTILTFGLLIDIWWGSWKKGLYIDKSLSLYYYSLVSPLVFYIISVILFPPLSEDRFFDLKRHFKRVEKKNYLAFIALFFSFLLGEYFFDGTISDLYFNISGIAVAIVGYFSRSLIVHRFILGLGWWMLLVHIGFREPFDESSAVLGNFSITEYLTIFIAFIYGYIASKYFHGWGLMISKFSQITFSKEHIAWSLLTFGLLLDFWTGSWLRENYITVNIGHFILSLLVPLTFYALSAVMFPVMKNGESIDLRDFFHSHRKIIYLLAGGTLLANTIVANSMEESNLLSSENMFRLIALVLTATAVLSGRALIERTVLIVSWATLVIHTVVQP